MPRPRKAEFERLTRQQNFRLTETEFNRLQVMARECRMTLSDFCRHMFLIGRVEVKQTRQLPFEVVMALDRIGVNLNQIARKLNATGQLEPAALERALERLNAVIAEQMGMEDAADDEDEGREGQNIRSTVPEDGP